MYIFIKETVPNNFAPVVAAHASLACYLKFENDPHMREWLNKSFKKVICTVSEKQFNDLKSLDNFNVTTESSLDNQEVAITFCPRYDKISESFKQYKLWKYIDYPLYKLKVKLNESSI